MLIFDLISCLKYLVLYLAIIFSIIFCNLRNFAVAVKCLLNIIYAISAVAFAVINGKGNRERETAIESVCEREQAYVQVAGIAGRINR